MTHSTHPLTLHSLFQPTDKYPRKFSLTSTDTQKDDQLDMSPCATCEERLDGPLMRLMNALLDVLIDVSFVVSVNILVDVAIHTLLTSRSTPWSTLRLTSTPTRRPVFLQFLPCANLFHALAYPLHSPLNAPSNTGATSRRGTSNDVTATG